MSLGNDGGKLLPVIVPSFNQEVFLIHETSVQSNESRWHDPDTSSIPDIDLSFQS